MTRTRVRSEIAWAGIDQALSSATNLGLSILAGRAVGASGLGLIFLGFSAFLLVLNLVRGFITVPFMIASSALEPDERDDLTRKCMTLTFSAAAAISVVMLLLGLVIPGPLGRSLLIFAPWIGVALVQDQWRAILFRDGRGAAAALNDGMWAVAMVVALPLAWAYSTDWSVVAIWGIGAATAALLGAWQIRLVPTSFSGAARFWKRELRRLGSWLATDSVLNAAGSQVIIIILAAILSTSDLGGIRVVQVVFAPMTLINEAFAFPGVPIMTRALQSSFEAARKWAWRLGFIAMAVVGLYLAVVIPFSSQILSRVFGPEFDKFTSLVFPTALGQIPAAAATGFYILLRVDRRVHGVVVVTAARTAVALVLTPLFAVWFGVLGAVWGFALAGFVSTGVVIFLGYLPGDVFDRTASRAVAPEPG